MKVLKYLAQTALRFASIEDGEISNNATGIICTNTTGVTDSTVRIYGGAIVQDKSNFQISFANGSAKDDSENIFIAQGVLEGDATVETSFGTMTFDQNYPDLWLGTASAGTQERIRTLVQSTSGQNDWDVKGTPLWFKATSDSLHFSVERPSSIEPGIGLHVGYIPLNADGTPVEGAQLTMINLINSNTIDVHLTDLTPGTSYALSFVVENKYYITINPADLTVYMGGEDGAHSVVTGADGSVTSSKSLPEPGFTFDLPDAINDLSKVIIQSTDSSAPKSWTIQSYDGEDHGVYKIVPNGHQDPVRLQFTDPDTQNTVISDQFIVGAELNKTFSMSIYKGAVGDVEAVVAGDTYGITYGVILNTGTLYVRGTTSKVQYAELNQDVASGRPGLSAEDGTTFTINDSDVEANTDGIALLFDNIIENTFSESNRTQLLQEKADEVIDKSVSANMLRNYDLKYLDLADRHNGNTWVKASDEVTIFWPYPSGTDKNTEFTLLHFENLHRDMSSNEISQEISKCTVSAVEIEKSETHVIFSVDTGGFSPFALVWETPKSTGGGGGGGAHHPDAGDSSKTYVIKAESGTGGSISPDGRVKIESGENQTFKIEAEDGFVIEDVLVDDESVGAVEEYIFRNVRDDHTIEVIFAERYSTGVEQWLNTTDHMAYLNGYTDGSFGANMVMTRAEAAQMFYNLLLDQNVPVTVSFADVPADAWYAEAVNTLASLGMLEGVGNDRFAPDRSITRAEFTAIAMRFARPHNDGKATFSDVAADDWYYEAVARAAALGWINGYVDGTFRPNNTITRAEVTAITNRMLGRAADASFVQSHADALRRFTDVTLSHWASGDIAEATNAHSYTSVDGAEVWEALA